MPRLVAGFPPRWPGSNAGLVMWDFVMDKSCAGAGFLRELRFPLPIYIPSASPQRPGVAAVPIASQKKKTVFAMVKCRFLLRGKLVSWLAISYICKKATQPNFFYFGKNRRFTATNTTACHWTRSSISWVYLPSFSPPLKRSPLRWILLQNSL
jgi:hypothetical protein